MLNELSHFLPVNVPVTPPIANCFGRKRLTIFSMVQMAAILAVTVISQAKAKEPVLAAQDIIDALPGRWVSLEETGSGASVRTSFTGEISEHERSGEQASFSKVAKPADDAEATGEMASNVAIRWWETFGQTGLTDMVDLALRENRDLRQAAARVSQAVAEARIAGADLWPQLDAAFGSQRQQQNFVGLPIPGSDGEVLSTRFDSHSFNFNLSWELDLWGRIRSGKKAAKADVARQASDYRGAQLSLAGRVTKGWWLAAEAARQLELAKLSATNYEQTVEQVRARYERGVRDALDLRLARSSAAAARALVLQRQRELEVAIRQLEVLVGRYPAGALEISGTLPEDLPAIPAGLPSDLLLRRPDLVAAREAVLAETSRVRAARAALFPRISLTASGGRTSAELEDLLSNSFNVWSLAGNMAQPLFQGGRLRAGLARARARMAEVNEAYAGRLLQAMSEVENGLSGEHWLQQREVALGEARDEADAARRLASERYQSGLEPYLTLLESQRRAWDLESQWLLVRRLRLDNRVELHLALGGGFPESGLSTDTRSVSISRREP